MQPLPASFKQLNPRHWRNSPSFIFAAVFLCSLLLQFGVFWHLRRAAVLDDFAHWSGEISGMLNYTDRWDLARFRQAEISTPHYCVLDTDGLVIDIAGFFPQFQFLHIAPIQNEPALQTILVPETEESWRILVHRLQDGVVILGVSPPEDVTHVDDRLIDNAKHFGTSIAEAILDDVIIDKNLDYAILDDNGWIREDYGGIPLKVVNLPDLIEGQVKELTSDSGTSYWMLATAFTDKTGRNVGKIIVFDKIPPKPWYSWRAWVIFLLSSSALATIVAFLFHRIRPHGAQISANDLASRIRCGETKTLELKSNLRWNSLKNDFDTQIENSILKTIVAFCNTEGGELLIGVADDGTILGIEKDGFKNSDKFLLHLRNLIVDRILPKAVIDSIDYEIVFMEKKPICHVHCRSSSEDIWLKPDQRTAEQFFVRSGPSSTQLSPKEAVAYIQNRSKKTKTPAG